MEMTKTNPAPRLSHSACALLTSDAEVGGPARSDDGHRALAAPCSASAKSNCQVLWMSFLLRLRRTRSWRPRARSRLVSSLVVCRR
jgi:hypothetical protein